MIQTHFPFSVKLHYFIKSIELIHFKALYQKYLLI